MPSKAGNQEHRGAQDQTHKVDLPKLPLEHRGSRADADRMGCLGLYCHRRGPGLVGEVGRVAFQLNFERFVGVS